MATQILMPALSPTMEEGTLAKWLVKEGDVVSSGDLLAEIETDKATMEFEAVDEGIVGKILVTEGTEGVKVNSAIAILVEEGEDVPESMPAAPAAPAAAEAPAEPVAAPAPTPAPAAAPAPATAAKSNRVFASPLARRIAADKGLDLAKVNGTGPKGRIVKADVIDLTQTAAPQPAALAPAAEAEVIPLNGMRKTIAARLTEAKQTVPHFYLRRDIQLDAVLAVRSQMNKGLEAEGVKLSVNDFIIKACARALTMVPNANVTWGGDHILRHPHADVAVAVAIEGGLFTPVVRAAETKSLKQISAEVKDLAGRARDKKLLPDEYQGGAFSLSNLGMFGIDNFDAVINPPHGSILAVGAGKKRPVVDANGDLTTATVMSVTLSCDHRSIDGALGAEFLDAIVQSLEHPLAMLA